MDQGRRKRTGGARRKGLLLLSMLGFAAAGCGTERPRFDPIEAKNLASNQGPVIRVGVDPSETTVNAVYLEWGRRTPEQDPNLIYTEAPPAGFAFDPSGPPFPDPFQVTYQFPSLPTWADPMEEGDLLDVRFRVSHTTEEGGEVDTWSNRRTFAIGPPVSPPSDDDTVDDDPGAPDPCDPAACANETRRVSIHTGAGSIDNQGGSRAPAFSSDCMVVAFSTPVAFDADDTNGESDVYVHDLVEGRTEWISSFGGGSTGANLGGSVDPSISADGRYVAFSTPVAFDTDDTNDALDVYLHDRETGEMERISVFGGNSSGANPGGSIQPSVSADGLTVAFSTPVSFDPNDTNGEGDVYLRDRQSDSTERVSVFGAGGGTGTNSGGSFQPSVSADGRHVAFATPVPFEPNDTDDAVDVYRHDRQTGETIWVSVHPIGGADVDQTSNQPSISADGNRIAFTSTVPFLPNDTNGAADVYVRDLIAGETRRASVYTGSGSIANNGGSAEPSLSADGFHVAFSTVVPFQSTDTNDALDVYVHDLASHQTRRVSIYQGSGSILNGGGS
ncbi:MAG: hypothetical protein GF328_10200, partial [Candidatus Latescibacteria bacterium]|nr:hypothetical protein [Candidatus Latescibacterota bacterium]